MRYIFTVIVFKVQCVAETCVTAKLSEEFDEGKLGLPRQYDKRYRVNLGIRSRNVEEFLHHGRLAGRT